MHIIITVATIIIMDIKSTISAISRYTGLEETKVRQVARALQDAKRLPISAPRAPKELNWEQVALLLLSVILIEPRRIKETKKYVLQLQKTNYQILPSWKKLFDNHFKNSGGLLSEMKPSKDHSNVVAALGYVMKIMGESKKSLIRDLVVEIGYEPKVKFSVYAGSSKEESSLGLSYYEIALDKNKYQYGGMIVTSKRLHGEAIYKIVMLLIGEKV